MSGVSLCTDSSALLPPAVARRLGVAVVRTRIAVNGDPWNGGEQEIDEFYERLSAGARATTSQPSPGSFLDAYVDAAERGATEVLSIHLDARVSGAVGSARLAASEAPIPVTVVDTGTASFGVAACVRVAAHALEEGGSVDDASRAVRTFGSTLRNVFAVGDAGGGRLPEVAGWAVLEHVDAESRLLETCSGPEEATGVMCERVLGANSRVRVAVGHASRATERVAGELASVLARAPTVAGGERYRVGPEVGAHTGPLSFGAFWWPVGG